MAALGSEFTASALLMQRWFPQVAVWLYCVIFAALLFLLNAFSVKWFGEAEFWFSLLKVTAIVVLLIVGFAAIFGINAGGEAPLLSNFMTEDGLLPTGTSGVFITILSVFYAFSVRSSSLSQLVKPKTHRLQSHGPSARCWFDWSSSSSAQFLSSQRSYHGIRFRS